MYIKQFVWQVACSSQTQIMTDAKNTLLQTFQNKFSTILENNPEANIPSTDHNQEQLWTFHNITNTIPEMIP